MLRLVSAFVITVLAHSALACPFQPLVEAPVTPAGAIISGDGGILLATAVASSPDRGAMPTGPQLRSGGDDVEVDVEYVAPALTLVRPKQAATRTLDLVDAKGMVLRSYEQRTAGKRLAAPRSTVVSTLTRAAATARRGPYPPQGTMTVTLAEDPPADAAVLVIQTATDKTGIAWTPVVAGQRAYSFGPAGKGCVPGPATARQGARLGMLWIDIHGQKSASSAVITVGRART